jgi:hypothetical protein
MSCSIQEIFPLSKPFVSATYKVFSTTPGIGAGMSDQECVTFFPKKNGGSIIRVTCAKGKFVVGSTYRIIFDPVEGKNVAS